MVRVTIKLILLRFQYFQTTFYLLNTQTYPGLLRMQGCNCCSVEVVDEQTDFSAIASNSRISSSSSSSSSSSTSVGGSKLKSPGLTVWPSRPKYCSISSCGQFQQHFTNSFYQQFSFAKKIQTKTEITQKFWITFVRKSWAKNVCEKDTWHENFFPDVL